MTRIIYLDHAATTPLHPEVKKKMDPYLEGIFGNPSSIHKLGREARSAIDSSRLTISRAINAHPSELIFTSGGTETNNLALMGVAHAAFSKGKNHVITSQVEHYAVLKTCEALEKLGFNVTYLPVDHSGRINLMDCKNAINENTALISIMYGNNEVGTLQPVQEVGELAKELGVTFHTDAVQAFGVEEIDVTKLGCDLLSLSSHKIYGPKGVGALYVSKDVHLTPGIYGGVQEKGRRAGTENVAGIVGFKAAVQLAMDNRKSYRQHLLSLRDTFLLELDEYHIKYIVNGSMEEFLPHILNISFLGVDSEVLLINLDMEEIACSSGSTCNSGVVGSSHVLKAMGLSLERCNSAIRFSFGSQNTKEEISIVAKKLTEIMQRLRNV